MRVYFFVCLEDIHLIITGTLKNPVTVTKVPYHRTGRTCKLLKNQLTRKLFGTFWSFMFRLTIFPNIS
jgi:hypothetical protein